MTDNPYGDGPVCLLIAICNDVIEDKRTNNKSLIGLFSNINVFSIPAAHPRMYLLVSLTNVVGEHKLRILMSTPGGGEARFDNTIRSENAEAVVDIVVQLENLALPELGQYSFQVWAGDELLAMRGFNVSLVQRQGGPAAPAQNIPGGGAVGNA